MAELGIRRLTQPGPSRAAHSPAVVRPMSVGTALLLTDAAAAALGVVLAGLIVPAPRSEYGQVAMWLVLWGSWLLALGVTRSRDPRVLGAGVDEFRRVATSAFIIYTGLAVAAVQSGLLNRSLITAVLVSGLLIMAGRAVWRPLLRRLRRHGRFLTGAIVIGSRQDVDRVVAELGVNPTAGYEPVAVAYTESENLPAEGPGGLPVVPMDHLVETARDSDTRAVMVAGDVPGGREQLRGLGWDLEDLQVELILVSRLTHVAGPRMHLRPVEGLPMVHVELAQYSGPNHTLKRAFDVAASATAIVLLAPLFLAIAVAVKVEDGGPIIFRQERVGAHGRRFTMLKFRSMVVDADRRLAELQALNEGSGVLFKLRNDPRVTGVGRFLRRTSLDELPQLFNVLGGSMSLVGPRPPLPREVEQYADPVPRRLLAKPGITGLWQVSGRSDLSWDESVRLDLYYVENWSLWVDLRILAQTAKAVVRPRGAY